MSVPTARLLPRALRRLERPRVLMLGDVGGPAHYHVGDEAMFTACVDWLRSRRADVEIVGVSADPEHTSRTLGITALPRPDLPRHALADGPTRAPLAPAIRGALHRRLGLADRRGIGPLHTALSSAGLLWICGGGNLTSLFARELRLRSFVARLALGLGRPVVLSGQTLGPDLTPEDAALLASWLPRAELVGVRDDGPSARLARRLGVAAERIRAQPDDAWDLRSAPAPEHLLTGRFRPRVGLSLHRRASGRLAADALAGRLAAVADRLTAAGVAELVFLPHVTSSAGESPDLAFAEALRTHMAYPERLRVVREALSDREVKHLTSRCDFVVSTRYHGVIFALASGVPCLALVQDDHTEVKMRGAFGVVGLAPEVAAVDDPALGASVLSRWKERDALAAELARREPGATARLAASRDAIATVVDRALGPAGEASATRAHEEPPT